MVEQVTKFIAKDGSQWSTLKEALEREILIDKCTVALLTLGKKVDLKAQQYIQHSVEDMNIARRRLYKLVQEHCLGSFPNLCNLDPDTVHPHSIIGRIVDDYGGPLSDAWSRLCRCNFDLYREYQQPYFALNPNEATKIFKDFA